MKKLINRKSILASLVVGVIVFVSMLYVCNINTTFSLKSLTQSSTNASLVLQLSSNHRLPNIKDSDIEGLAGGLDVVSIEKTDDKTAIIKLKSVKGYVGNYYITALNSNSVYCTVYSEQVSKDPIVFKE